jgi:2-oxoglutarate ferredoxin oxidoreductase subunit alpha
MQIKAIPFTQEVHDFIHAHERNYVVELNRDGQMHQLLRLEYPEKTMTLISMAHIDGLPISANWVVKTLSTKEDSLND